MPNPTSHVGQVKSFYNILHTQHGNVLLVCQHEQNSLFEFFLCEHSVELVFGNLESVLILGVHDEDNRVAVAVVVSPHWSKIVLTAHVPHVKLDVLKLDRLNVESNGGLVVLRLSQFELVKYRALPGGVESEQQNLGLFASIET